jgi:hypothetical protein
MKAEEGCRADEQKEREMGGGGICRFLRC